MLADVETPVSAFLKIAGDRPYSYLLESVEGGERWGRYSFIAWAPKKVFKSSGNKVAVFSPGEKEKWMETASPLLALKELMSEYVPVQIEGLPRFWGGAVGYVSYDMVRFFEELPDKPKDTLGLPESCFLLTDKIIIFDHLTHKLKVVVCLDLRDGANVERLYAKAKKEIDAVIRGLKKNIKEKPRKKTGSGRISSNMTKPEFCEKVEKAKEYIRAGDIFQTVFSQRFERKTGVGDFEIYRNLRLINPSPYMYFLRLKGFSIIGTSPEILVRKEGDTAEMRPIAGTRKRGKDEADDADIIKDLLADAKEKAEHVMLVDLARNDLARVCEAHSVTVPDFMTIEKYSHVMHIVSSVTGKLKPGLDAFELFKASFPAGTVSGAPKVRAMEIIDELEPTARGPYAGSVGYFCYSGNMDMAITIRTIVLKDKTAYMQAGAGIVADSVPEKEYEESKNKAAALFSALDQAEK
ncbi:MAG: anthranilate synthase component I [Endomicrobiales bacterium]|nr:anthranilate synthase component I [Endomicrobiales bacterium]